MSFFSGPPTLHLPSDAGQVADFPARRVRTSQSHASIVGPLVRTARDPISCLTSLLENLVAGRQAEDQLKIDYVGPETRRLLLKQKMRDAVDYTTWKQTALELDSLSGNDIWKCDSSSPFYDDNLLQLRLEQLNEARMTRDSQRMVFLLRTSLTRGLGNMGDRNLYKSSYIGTKRLIENYISAACETLDALLTSLDYSQNSEVETRYVLERLLETRQSFGRSALLLSGGGTFGMTHIGVVKCLWEQNLLPRIVCGSSAGSIVCAVLCARTEAQIPAMLEDLCSEDLDVFERSGQEESLLRKLVRFAKYGALSDIRHLIRVMRNLLGDLTFQEAYNRTRRILNISVSSANLHEMPRLLNFITAPNVMIWSAVAASCSVPLIFLPATILAKDPKTGAEVPWNPSPQFWIDGSVDNDLPMTRLSEMFNVNHFIVSQVNPHVIPFLVEERSLDIQTEDVKPDGSGQRGSSLLHICASFAKNETLHRMHVLSELGIFPNYFTKLRSVLSQKYSGDITIIPEIAYPQFTKILQNPTPEFIMEAMLAGQRATWPKLSRIQNHCAIELALDNAVQKLRTHIAFSPSQVDLRMMSIGEHVQPNRTRTQKRHRSRQEKTKSWVADTRHFNLSPFALKVRPTTISMLQQRLKGVAYRAGSPELTTSDDSDDEDDGDARYLSLGNSWGPRTTFLVDQVSDSCDSSMESGSPSSEPASPDEFDSASRSMPRARHLFPHRSQPGTPFLLGDHRLQPLSPSQLHSGVRSRLLRPVNRTSTELSADTWSPAATRVDRRMSGSDSSRQHGFC